MWSRWSTGCPDAGSYLVASRICWTDGLVPAGAREPGADRDWQAAARWRTEKRHGYEDGAAPGRWVVCEDEVGQNLNPANVQPGHGTGGRRWSDSGQGVRPDLTAGMTYRTQA